ncbi:MAG: hypothetical protein GTO18_16190 [Anaerolineales bacterium]|nr:hypothetical protein [Anaerolineales bacterium]
MGSLGETPEGVAVSPWVANGLGVRLGSGVLEGCAEGSPMVGTVVGVHSGVDVVVAQALSHRPSRTQAVCNGILEMSLATKGE